MGDMPCLRFVPCKRRKAIVEPLSHQRVIGGVKPYFVDASSVTVEILQNGRDAVGFHTPFERLS